jgi:hypothetical protein
MPQVEVLIYREDDGTAPLVDWLTWMNPPQAAGIHPGRSGGFLVLPGFSPLIST